MQVLYPCIAEDENLRRALMNEREIEERGIKLRAESPLVSLGSHVA